MIASLLEEIALRKIYLGTEMVETIYFGGGTPSLLETGEITDLLDSLGKYFNIAIEPEITLEANPDDINSKALRDWKAAGINRLSIGIQSFYEEDLTWMNRAHNAVQAVESLDLAGQYFKNITMDLIYGHPLLTYDKWKNNVENAVASGVPHLSCYALTVEPGTPLNKMIREKKKENVDAGKQADQFLQLIDWMEAAGYEHYEISNFARPGYRSRHNSSYWQGKKYLGIGPSAHSFDGKSRQWNVSNNMKYMESLKKKIIPSDTEVLTPVQQLNEYIMTSLRTAEGIDLEKIPEDERKRISATAEKYVKQRKIIFTEKRIVLSREGKLFADGIAADLFSG